MSDRTESSNELSTALSDIEFIRRSIEQGAWPDSPALRAETIIATVLLVVALMFLALELFYSGPITQEFLLSASDEELRQNGLFPIVGTLALLLGGVYLLAWRRAREIESTLSRTLNRDFPFLRIENLLPDLLLKFFVLSLLICIRRPDLVSALFVAFTTDYVLQGRFFRIPKPERIPLAIILYSLAGFMVISGKVSLVYSLVSFSLVSALSLIFTIKRQRSGASI